MDSFGILLAGCCRFKRMPRPLRCFTMYFQHRVTVYELFVRLPCLRAPFHGLADESAVLFYLLCSVILNNCECVVSMRSLSVLLQYFLALWDLHLLSLLLLNLMHFNCSVNWLGVEYNLPIKVYKLDCH